MQEEKYDDLQNNVLEFKVNSLTNGHLKTISLLLMVIISIIDSYVENSYFTYFSQTLLKYIGTWLSFSTILFIYILGRNFYYSTPFRFRHILISSIYKYIPIFLCVLLIVVPVSLYLMPELPEWSLRDDFVDENIGFILFYKLYIEYAKKSVTFNFVCSRLINRVLFWISLPLIKTTLFPVAASILCSSHKIKRMKDQNNEKDYFVESSSINLSKDELENIGLIHKENHIKELSLQLEESNSCSKKLRFFTLTFTIILITFLHSLIIMCNKRRAVRIVYPLKLSWTYVLSLCLFGIIDIITSLINKYKVTMYIYSIIGITILSIPCFFTYDQVNIVSRYYCYSCFFLFGVWDSSLEFITGKGSLHHFRFSTLVKYFLASIFIYSVATGSKLLWSYDNHYNAEVTPRLKLIGSIGIALSIYYLSIKKTILIKRKYQWINKLRNKYSMDPAVFCYFHFVPSKKTFWRVLKKDSFKLLAFVPITTVGITYILTEKLLFGAFESFFTVLFISPMICLFFMNISQIFTHVSNLSR